MNDRLRQVHHYCYTALSPPLPPPLPLPLSPPLPLMSAAGLRKKSVVPGSTSIEQKLRQAAGAPELFMQSDVVVKHVLEVSGVWGWGCSDCRCEGVCVMV